MDVTILKDKITFSKSAPHKAVICDTEKATAVLICLESGQSAGEYSAKGEASLFVLDGKGSFIIAGKEKKVEKGSLIVCGGNESHNIKADYNMVVLAVIAK